MQLKPWSADRGDDEGTTERPDFPIGKSGAFTVMTWKMEVLSNRLLFFSIHCIYPRS